MHVPALFDALSKLAGNDMHTSRLHEAMSFASLVSGDIPQFTALWLNLIKAAGWRGVFNHEKGNKTRGEESHVFVLRSGRVLTWRPWIVCWYTKVVKR